MRAVVTLLAVILLLACLAQGREAREKRRVKRELKPGKFHARAESPHDVTHDVNQASDNAEQKTEKRQYYPTEGDNCGFIGRLDQILIVLERISHQLTETSDCPDHGSGYHDPGAPGSYYDPAYDPAYNDMGYGYDSGLHPSAGYGMGHSGYYGYDSASYPTYHSSGYDWGYYGYDSDSYSSMNSYPPYPPSYDMGSAGSYSYDGDSYYPSSSYDPYAGYYKRTQKTQGKRGQVLDLVRELKDKLKERNSD